MHDQYQTHFPPPQPSETTKRRKDMSLSPPRSRPNNNNNEATTPRPLYWCYQCHRAVWLPAAAATDPSQITCPQCSSQFLTEIEPNRPRLVVDFAAFDPSPEARLLEALSLILEPPIRQFNHNLLGEAEPLPSPLQPRNDRSSRRRRRTTPANDQDQTGIQSRPRTWIVFRPIDPFNPTNEPTMRRLPQNPFNIPPGVNPRDYFLGPGLNGLIEQLTQNDRPGPPPATEEVINSIPTVKIAEGHLVEDCTQCPVCKEEFKVGGEARELPCKHIYHEECIVPWLRLHNSCPVCRQEVTVGGGGGLRGGRVGGEEEASGESERDGGRCWRLWRQLASLWPFRPRFNGRVSHGSSSSSSSHEAINSGRWSCNIL